MSSHLFRRGGLWWARLVVPARLRNAVGRREFIQSCRTHEIAIAKMVSAALLAGWRQRLLQMDSRQMSVDVLKLVGGSPVLHGGGYVPLAEAVGLSGISQAQLLRAAADGALNLFCRLSQVPGHVVPCDDLELINPEAGRPGGVVVPQPRSMPLTASEATRGGVLPVCDSADVAGAVLADGLKTVTIIAFDVPDRPGMIFAPDKTVVLKVEKLEVLVTEVEALRQLMAASVSPDIYRIQKSPSDAFASVRAWT